MSENEHPLDYLAELALGALSEDEAAPLREHVASCETCRAEYELMTNAARMLPYAAQDAEPSPAIREGLFERIAAEPVALRPRVIRPAWQRFTAIAAAAAVLVIAGGLAGMLMASNGGGGFEEEATRQRSLVRAVADGDARRDTMESGATRATLVYAPGADSAFALLEGLPALPEGKEYQAWFIADGPPLPSDVFTSASEGVWLASPDEVRSFAAFAVTIEDEGGVESSKEQPVLVMNLGQAASVPFTMGDWLALTMR